MPPGVLTLTTPKNRITVAMLAALLYLTAPIVEWFYYSTELARGSYPVNADSIGLPVGLFTIVWLTGLPLVLVVIWFILRSYPGSVSLFGFNAARPYWSIMWSLLFAYPVIHDIIFCVRSAFLGNPLDVLQSGLLAYLMFCLRSSIIYGDLFFSRGKVASLGEA